MASHRRPKQPSRTRVTVLTTAAAAAVALSANAANAAPSEKLSKDEVKAKVDKLYEQAEQATEKYNGAKEKQQKLQKEISTVQDDVARGQQELNKLRDGLGSLATAQYRSGGIDPSVQLLLSSNPDDYLDKASTLDQLSSQQVDALKKIQDKQRELAQERAEAAEKLKDLSSTRTQLEEKKKEVQGKLAEAQKLLNTLTAKEKAELAAKQERANRSSSDRVDLGDAPPASGRASAAFSAAQSKIGTPYVYGATGPSSFDCSGLTSWAYGQAGVSIPRTSEAQANYGTRVYSQSDLKVGDLVFFYGDLHHVGLYAGNGQVLHAPHTGAVVRYEAIGNMPFQFGVRV
ncbi:Cell wall-associated hydrolase, NlpC family [Streptomyces sp. 1222.5]|uniref:C40 family peptidase n=1 Tax=unclassified Streptomyces TaxID=2593676 RepID=UPI00089D0D2A|nr:MULTISPECIES: C40 family peptidase [unclassified Streptomyces]PKW07306.1 cell wall-associated NlpC family hydrolase [Streptomyces sp. 5112.2]SEC84361.1 Cell wall-associated hydrolase, NlpC family [Streptomyces sp. 2231.1]SEC92217.1 Cell wall-associated hydrolase, NlpC family [Streptomyces sp. 1222.5]